VHSCLAVARRPIPTVRSSWWCPSWRRHHRHGARLIAQRLTDICVSPSSVSNRPGGGSTIGTSQVAKAAPDGHTLLVTTIAFAINASLQKQPYDAVKDFAAISELASIR
jgi:tripartite-type tricarboxylate transporter receptor subunit TctC